MDEPRKILTPWDRFFIRSDGKDMRRLPMVQHPHTGKWHYDHGFWPIDTWAAERAEREPV